jgi:hypothetical protein
LIYPFADVADKKKKQNNQFQKQHFLNRLNKIADLKSVSKRVNQKKIAGDNLKKNKLQG